MDLLRLVSSAHWGYPEDGDVVSRWHADLFELNDAAGIGQKGLYKII